MTVAKSRPPKLFVVIGEALNQDADDFFAGIVTLSRRPCEPSFWFFNTALDSNVLSWSDYALDTLLNENARRMVMWLREHEVTTWCTCVDHSFNHGAHVGGFVPCWPCIFDCHDRCSFDCSDSAVFVTFPETRMRMREAVAA